MSNRRLASILGGCMAIIAAIVAIACFPPASGKTDENSTFHINVIPQTPERIEGVDTYKLAIPGQRFVFLVTITEEGEGSEFPVHISATAPGAEVVIYHSDILEREVAEVVVIPGQASIGQIIEVTITGSRGDVSDEKAVSLEVAEGEDDRQEYAQELLDKFVVWLAANRPELGVTEDTEWQGTTVSPIWLVVSHYLFFSEEWELHLAWHVMIPPHDWARIELRHRFDELAPLSCCPLFPVLARLTGQGKFRAFLDP